MIESMADGKSGHWLYTVHNGKESRVWVDYNELIEKRKAAEKNMKAAAKSNSASEKRKIAKEISKIEDKMFDINSEIKDYEEQYRELMIDMEEDLGPLYASGTKEDEFEAERRAQDWGGKMNDIEDAIEKLQQQYKQLNNKYLELQKKL